MALCTGRGQPDVPDRGPGAVAVGRGAGVPGPGGRAGEAARVPDRAWRDRGCAAAAGGRVAGGGDGARRRRGWAGSGGARRASVWSAMWWRRPGLRLMRRRLRSALSREPAGLHGAVGDRCAGSAAADAERQAGPARAAGAGAVVGAFAPCAAHIRRRRSCARCLPRCWALSGSGSTTTSSSWAATASCRSSW